MFLTRMQINSRRRGAQKLLGSPQAMHAAVMSGFPDAAPTTDGRVLWRVDTRTDHKVFLYTASPDKPDFTHIVEQAGWPTTETWDTRSYHHLLDGLRTEQVWHFRLTANPVHHARREGWTATKPLAHVTVDQQSRWLLDRADRCGFRILDRQTTGDSEVGKELIIVDRAVHRFTREKRRVTIATATFEGLLEVTDPAMLRRTLALGLGRAKSYGCGLLTLAPPRTGDRP